MSNRTGPGPDRSDREPGRRRRPRTEEPPERRPEVEPVGDLVMVRFKGHRKASYHNTRCIALAVGDYCMVEADRGRDMGRVCYIGPGNDKWWREARHQGVLHLAAPEDLERLHENRADEWEYYDICLEKIQQRQLKMELVTVERQFDRNKITFYFTAEKRVDFRQLVKDLASVFRTRIELRQIGVRDEAKIKGGLGICGRELCCSAFLSEFSPVTLKMAKTQQLPLSPNKLSGLCGRLRCCLSYEHETYRETQSRMPRVGAAVETPTGAGRVRKLDLLREEVAVFLDEAGEMRTYPVTDLGWENDQDLPRARGRRRRPGCCHEPKNH